MCMLLLRSHSLPSVLYIQMENCSHENNKTILTFASMLVELDMSRKVCIQPPLLHNNNIRSHWDSNGFLSPPYT